MALKGGGHLGGEGRRVKSGAEGHQELETLRDGRRAWRWTTRRPRKGSGRGEGADKAQLLGSLGHLAQVADSRIAPASDRALRGTMTATDDVAAVS